MKVKVFKEFKLSEEITITIFGITVLGFWCDFICDEKMVVLTILGFELRFTWYKKNKVHT